MGRGRGRGSALPDEEEEDTDGDVAQAGESDEEAVLFGAGVEEAGDGDDMMAEGDARSLFGPESFESAGAFWKHSAEKHGFSISGLRERMGHEVWTDYHRIRLVNYLRSLGPEAARREAPRLGPDSVIWEDDAWLKPVLEDDLLLFEDDESEDDLDDSRVGQVLPSDSAVTGAVPEGEAAALADEVSRLRAELASMRRLLSEDDDEMPAPDCALIEKSAVPAHQPVQQEDATAELARAFVLAPGLAKAVRDTLMSKPLLVEGQAVLDVDCGAGLVACICSQLGAQRVMAVSCSAKASALAQSLAAANGCDDDVTLSEELPMRSSSGPAYGLLVSERLLSEPLYSPRLTAMLAACRLHLRHEGAALPARVALHASAGDFSSEADRNEAWRRPCAELGGLDVTALAPDGSTPPYAEFRITGSNHFASTGAVELLSLDVATAKPDAVLAERAPFRFELRPECCMTALVLVLQVSLLPGEEVSEPNWTQRHLVLHLPAQGPPPRRSLRLQGSEYPVVEGHLTVCQGCNGGPLEIQVELAARHGGSTGSEFRTSGTFAVP